MSIDDETDDDGEAGNGAASFLELLADAIIAARDLALSAKIKPAELKKRAKFERGLTDIQAKCVALTTHAEQTKATLDERAAELDARAAELERREISFENQAQDVRDELREHHARLEQMHRQLVHRIMSTAGILGNWNFDRQGVPSWEQLRRQIADLPPDHAPAAEVVTQEVTTDWTGHTFIAGSSLTRSVPQ
jgi:hypothetical protein